MKTPRLFNSTRMFAFVRLAVAGTCVLTAAALAIVATATNNNSSDLISKSRALKETSQTAVSINYEDPYQKGDEDGTIRLEGPTGAEQEAYMHRAYPGPDEIDLGALINAQAGLQNFLANATPAPVPTVSPAPTSTPVATATPTATPKRKRGRRTRGTPTPTPTPVTVIDDRPSPPEPSQLPIWQEVTGNAAVAPNIMTFTGSTQLVSGRITALAIDTFNSCT